MKKWCEHIKIEYTTEYQEPSHVTVMRWIFRGHKFGTGLKVSQGWKMCPCCGMKRPE